MIGGNARKGVGGWYNGRDGTEYVYFETTLRL